MGVFVMSLKFIRKIFRRNRGAEEYISTVIGRDTIIDGLIGVGRSIRIDGPFKGRISVADTLVVDKSGKLVDVTVTVKDAIIGGTIAGHFTANNKVIFKSTSRFEGDLTTKLLVIEESAVFIGKCRVDKFPDSYQHGFSKRVLFHV